MYFVEIHQSQMTLLSPSLGQKIKIEFTLLWTVFIMQFHCMDTYLSSEDNKSSESEPASLWDAVLLLLSGTRFPLWEVPSAVIMLFLTRLLNVPKISVLLTGLLRTWVSAPAFFKGEDSVSAICVSSSESLTMIYGCNWSYMYLSIFLACLFVSEGFRPYFLSSFCKETQTHSLKERIALH